MSYRGYSFFTYRRNTLPLDREQAFELERAFTAVRYIHNHFATTLGGLKKSRLKLLDLSQAAFHAVVDVLVRPEEDSIFHGVHSSFIESAVSIIADDWRRYANGYGPLPLFIYARDEQTIWLTDPKHIHVFQEGYTLPGDNAIIHIQPSKIRLLGKPTICYLHRSFDRRYYLVTMYEMAVEKPHQNSLEAVIRFGALLQKALKEKKDDSWKDRLPESLTIPGLIRKRTLIKLLHPKPEKVELEAESDDFTF